MNINYARLYDHYRKMFSLVDSICFNSANTKRIYGKYLQLPAHGTVLPMVHAGIADNRVLRSVDAANLRLGFIGSVSPYKGFPMLKEVLIELLKEGVENWSLAVWGGPDETCSDCERIRFRGKYESGQLHDVLNQMDLLLVPSVWNETFSLITLEALSHGVPVLTSSTVGAKDIVANYDESFIFKGRDELKSALSRLLNDTQPLQRYNRRILEMAWPYSHEAHVEAVRAWYESTIAQDRLK